MPPDVTVPCPLAIVESPKITLLEIVWAVAPLSNRPPSAALFCE